MGEADVTTKGTVIMDSVHKALVPVGIHKVILDNPIKAHVVDV